MKVFVDRDTINDDVVLVIEIYKTHNSTVKTDDEVVTVETSKTTIDIISPCDGTLSIDINVGDEIEVGDLLFQVLNDEEMESSENKKAEKNEEEKSLSAHIFSKEAEKKIKERVKLYIDTFVICQECNRPDTDFSKRGRTLILDCQACGGKRPIRTKLIT